jgi:hypothetical protein
MGTESTLSQSLQAASDYRRGPLIHERANEKTRMRAMGSLVLCHFGRGEDWKIAHRINGLSDATL